MGYPVQTAGMLMAPDGTIIDSRYPWFVVLRVLYAVPSAAATRPIQ